MPMLNFTKGKGATPVAVVRGGDEDGKILYIHPEGKMTAGSGVEPDPKKYVALLKMLKPSERTKVIADMVGASERGILPTAYTPKDTAPEHLEAVRNVYAQMMKDIEGDHSINLPPESIFNLIPNPDPEARQIWYAAGISGSGKSFMARTVAENYKKMFPDREVYLISQYPVEEDDTLGTMKVGRPKSISLKSLLDEPPDVEEFERCLTIFDDYDVLPKPYDKVVQKLIDTIAIRGRHTQSSMFICSHYLTNYKNTRIILSESHYLILYPMATSFKALSYVCEHYGGLTKDEVQSLKKMGRWVALHKVFPPFLISAHHARLLNE